LDAYQHSPACYACLTGAMPSKTGKYYVIQAWDLFVNASKLLIGYSDSSTSSLLSSFANNGVSVLYILACMEFFIKDFPDFPEQN